LIVPKSLFRAPNRRLVFGHATGSTSRPASESAKGPL
jgi:hypothetical protein